MPDHQQPSGLGAIFEVARRLRATDGCPWDREQTHESLRPYLLEEAYELLEVIDRGLGDAKLQEELGDVLLQIAMHAAIAEEEGRFDAVAVSEAAAAKMIARHPHVYGDEQVADADGVLRSWERRKAQEAAQAGRAEKTPLDRVPATLPALAWTFNMQKRAARVGFDVESSDAAAAGIAARTAEARAAGASDDREAATRAVGELLLAAVTLARTLKVNPEDALRAAGQRYRDRFAAVDGEVRSRGLAYRDLAPAEQADLWERAST